jgi:hypothetical protein
MHRNTIASKTKSSPKMAGETPNNSDAALAKTSQAAGDHRLASHDLRGVRIGSDSEYLEAHITSQLVIKQPTQIADTPEVWVGPTAVQGLHGLRAECSYVDLYRGRRSDEPLQDLPDP